MGSTTASTCRSSSPKTTLLLDDRLPGARQDRGSAGKRASAATNDLMPPPRPPARSTASPSTGDLFGFPLLKGFEAAGMVLGDVEGDDDVVGDRPPLPRCLGLVNSLQARESHGRYRHGACSCRRIGSVAEKQACNAEN